ncbi:MAG: Lipopolysaccharide heptosyltransferase 1 [Betaproteobacteria bacterium ADurb.Bin341]|nr:MAG: Lipopolysaccharide heptosyltransferase 1 [Betaproteobacteria bacterium ADurb.Bin341]
MRILIVQISTLGDVVHALPVISDVRREFPKLAIDWCIDEKYAAIPRLHPAIDRVLPVPTQRWRQHLFSPASWREMRDFRLTLRAVDYDAVLDLQGTLYSALLARQACGPACGYDAAAAHNRLAARFYDATFIIPKIVHPVERKRWLAAAVLELPLETPLDYGINAAPLTADWLPAQPYVVFLSAACHNDKLWPEAYWIELGQALQARGNTIVLPAKTEEERTRAASIAAAIDNAIMAPPLGIEAMAGLLVGAAGIIGKISPLLHLAAALQRPAVSLLADSDAPTDGILSAAPFRNLGGQGTIPDVHAVLNAFLTCTRP